MCNIFCISKTTLMPVFGGHFPIFERNGNIFEIIRILLFYHSAPFYPPESCICICICIVYLYLLWGLILSQFHLSAHSPSWELNVTTVNPPHSTICPNIGARNWELDLYLCISICIVYLCLMSKQWTRHIPQFVLVEVEKLLKLFLRQSTWKICFEG